MPGFFRVQEDIEIAGRKYRGIGNVELLQAARLALVHVRRTMIDEAMYGDISAKNTDFISYFKIGDMFYSIFPL